MSGSDAVWPDGAREAVQRANETAMVLCFNTRQGYDRWADAILTALEPFVQQRIAQSEAAGLLARYEANHKTAWELVEQRGKELASLREVISRKNDVEAQLRGAIRASDERLDAAAHKVGLPPSGCDAADGMADEILALRAEVARLREDGERRQSEVLQLRALVAALPIGECQASAALQGWWDQMKAVMAGTNPVWLVEPRGCPTPGACSCPGVRLDAARSAPGGEG